MKVTLKVLAPVKWAGKVIPIACERFLIGRDADCQLRPSSSQVSGRHCAVLLRSGRVFLRDLESITGTTINGRQIKGEIELLADDRLTIGPLTLAVAIEAAVAAAAKPSPQQRQPREGTDDDAVAAMMLFMENSGSDPAIEVGADTVDTPLASTCSDKPATGPADKPARLPPIGKPRQSDSAPSRELMQKLLGTRR